MQLVSGYKKKISSNIPSWYFIELYKTPVDRFVSLQTNKTLKKVNFMP